MQSMSGIKGVKLKRLPVKGSAGMAQSQTVKFRSYFPFSGSAPLKIVPACKLWPGGA